MSGQFRCRDKEACLPQAAMKSLFIEPEKLSARELSRALSDAERIEAWLAAVRTRATVLATNGASIPGYKLVTRRITRRWRNETRALKALRRVIRGSGLKQVDLFERRLKSPARLEKLFSSLGRRAVDAVNIEVSYSENGVVLAPQGDPRMAVQSHSTVARTRRRPRSAARDSLRPSARRTAPVKVEERVAMN